MGGSSTPRGRDRGGSWPEVVDAALGSGDVFADVEVDALELGGEDDDAADEAVVYCLSLNRNGTPSRHGHEYCASADLDPSRA